MGSAGMRLRWFGAQNKGNLWNDEQIDERKALKKARELYQ
jgi:hypothetical protein